MNGHGGKRRGAGRRPNLSDLNFLQLGIEYLRREQQFIKRRRNALEQKILNEHIEVMIRADPEDPGSKTKFISQNYIDYYRWHLAHANQIPIQTRLMYRGKELSTVPGQVGEVFGDIQELIEEVRKRYAGIKSPKRPYGIGAERKKIFQKVLVWGRKRYGLGVTDNQLRKSIKLAKNHLKNHIIY